MTDLFDTYRDLLERLVPPGEVEHAGGTPESEAKIFAYHRVHQVINGLNLLEQAQAVHDKQTVSHATQLFVRKPIPEPVINHMLQPEAQANAEYVDNMVADFSSQLANDAAVQQQLDDLNRQQTARETHIEDQVGALHYELEDDEKVVAEMAGLTAEQMPKIDAAKASEDAAFFAQPASTIAEELTFKLPE